MTRRQHEDASAGFGLAEVLVAMALLLVLVSGVLIGLGDSLNLSRDSRNRTVAANLASQEVDAVQAAEDVNTVNTEQRDVTVGGNSFTVLRSVAWSSADGQQSVCDGGAGTVLAYKRVSVSVTWPRMRGTAPVRNDTIINPGVAAYDPSKGNVAVKVFNRDAGPIAALSVTLTGPAGTRTLLTAEDGCAFFPQLTPGSYVATVDRLGYVDFTGTSTVSVGVSVNAGETTAAQIDYDEAATLEVSFLPPAENYRIPESLPVTLGNTSLLPRGTRTVPGTGPARSLPNLFPFAAGYTMWAGGCADADPQGEIVADDGTGATTVVGAYHPEGVRDPAVLLEPGGTAAGQIQLSGIDVRLTGEEGSPVSGSVALRATHESDYACTGESIELGVTNPDGTLSVALPYGTWAIRASGFDSREVTLHPGDAPAAVSLNGGD